MPSLITSNKLDEIHVTENIKVTFRSSKNYT